MKKHIFIYFFAPIFIYASKADAQKEINVTTPTLVRHHMGSLGNAHPTQCHVDNGSIATVHSTLENDDHWDPINGNVFLGYELVMTFTGHKPGEHTGYNCGVVREGKYEEYVYGTITNPPMAGHDFSLSKNQTASYDWPLGVFITQSISPHCVVVSSYVEGTASSYTYGGAIERIGEYQGIHAQFKMISEPPFYPTRVLYSCGLWESGVYQAFVQGTITLTKTNPQQKAPKTKNIPKKVLK